MEGVHQFYQVYPVVRIPGEGRAECLNPFLRGTKSDDCGRNASVYHVYPVSCMAGKGRAEFIRGRGGGGAGRVPTVIGRMNV